MGHKKHRNKRAKRSKKSTLKNINQITAPEQASTKQTLEPASQPPVQQDALPVWLRWLDNIHGWQALLIIAVIGLVTFSSGFHNPFRGDDDLQIVQNIPVHSISNIGTFFTGSTFYSFDANDPLTGQFYRPLMTTAFSLIYTIFGAEPLYFHLLQALLMIGAAFFLYLILSFSVHKKFALLFSLIYLVHPLSSQIIFAIPSTQDALMQLFGLAGLWSLIRFQSTKAMAVTLLLLTLAVFSKEAGMLYFALAFLFLLFFDRTRLKRFTAISVSILVIYMFIRHNAIGSTEVHSIGPISEAGLGARLMTIPSILALYLGKLIWPASFSSSYNWVVSHFSLAEFVLPLIAVFSFIAILLYTGRRLRGHATKLDYMTYVYYAVWFFLSISVYLQLKPLDMTVAEPWFAIPFVGLIGMLAVTTQYLSDTWRRAQLVITLMLLVLLPILSVRTHVRGNDWSTAQNLAIQDIRTSDSNYIAYNDLANYLFTNNNYTSAREAAQKSVDLYSTSINNDTLGRSCMALKDYECAFRAFDEGLRHFDFAPTLLNKAVLTAYYGDPSENREYLISVTNLLPEQPYPWFYLALVDYTKLDLQDEARTAIQKAYNLSQDPYITEVYNTILRGEKLNIIIE